MTDIINFIFHGSVEALIVKSSPESTLSAVASRRVFEDGLRELALFDITT
jgi:hypothetical protein